MSSVAKEIFKERKAVDHFEIKTTFDQKVIIPKGLKNKENKMKLQDARYYFKVSIECANILWPT